MHGGDLAAQVLKARGVPFLFTLCGGHISPILVACKQRGIRVIDVRHEATAVFAADAVARLTGTPGVAAVTAGPGVTNTITAIKNAQLGQSPVVLLGGATATALKGRGALQDIDQMSLVRPHVKWAAAIKRLRDLVPVLEEAFDRAARGVPGPVFVECPVDLLYDESLIRQWYGGKSQPGRSLGARLLNLYLARHVDRLFAGSGEPRFSTPRTPPAQPPDEARVRRVAAKLRAAKRPVLLVGSQALLEPRAAADVAEAVKTIGVPVYLAGMARGLLGRGHPLLARHERRSALKEADLVILAGVPCDFRLDYGRHIRADTYLISANRSREDLYRNRRPSLAVPGDPGRLLRQLADESKADPGQWLGWQKTLQERDRDRNQEIGRQAAEATGLLNPLALCQEIEQAIDEESVLVADGGDFVATASYVINPRAPLSWLDPGAFGTLGVGAGFALGAKLVSPHAEVWILYGDGSVGYSLSEFDTFVRHHVPVIAVVGNDACWSQIAREQVEIFKDDVGCALAHADYHVAARGLGAMGFVLREPMETSSVLREAKKAAADGKPVLVNAHIGKTDFRKGAISI